MAVAAPATNRFVWYEVHSPDVDRAVAFYKNLFGWTTDDVPIGEGQVYHIWKNGDAQFGGAFKSDPSEGDMAYWIGYISTPDVDDLVRRAEKAGATVIVPPADIPGTGRFAILRDPQGAHFATINLLPEAPAAPDDLETPVHGVLWNELIVDDPAAGATFYGDLFGWSSRTMADPNGGPEYTLLSRGERPDGQPWDTAGILKRPEMVPVPNWTFYVHVADVNATVAKATELGGNVLAPVFEVPGIGHIGVIQDPTSGVIAVMQPIWPTS